jgi:NAD+ synthase (glutamine-hydrolysing)
MALGWATYNGDQMSNYSVNCGVPKTLVKYLVKWYAEQSEEPLKGILENIYNTPISPELLPLDKEGGIAQKTENKIGPYELHDFFLYNFIRGGFSKEKVKFLCGITFEEYTQEDIDKWFDVFIKRFFQNQFKRSAVPDGPKVGSVCLSPRGDWRMPSDAVAF